MISYYDLTIPFRSLLILGLFLETCFGGYLIPAVFRKKKWFPMIMNFVGVVICGVLMIIYTAQARASLRNLEVPQMSDWLCKQSIFFPVVIFLVFGVCVVYLLLQEITFRKNTITRSSIKEGVDKISSGLCFYLDGGRVVLANYCMNELCFAIVGRNLQNAKLFWEILSGGEVKAEVQRLSFGSRPSFRLPDGTVWTFAYEYLDGINQLTAANTTQVQAVTDELKEKNIELAALNYRLRKHGENVDALTRSKERLETKARIHSELGQVLLSTRRFLLNEEENQEPPIELWQRNIAMLRKEAEYKEDEQPMEMLSRIAVSTGIAIQLSGEFPYNIEVQKLFVQAAAEALTNAISHAQAQTLYIDLQENENSYIICFKNDGTIPNEEIIEGGGLGSLRKKIESAGGKMKVAGSPEFKLNISLPKERGDYL